MTVFTVWPVLFNNNIFNYKSKFFIASWLFLHIREIFRVLSLMRADMVNCTIENLRPVLQRQSVEYERAKFQSILDKTPSEWITLHSSLYITFSTLLDTQKYRKYATVLLRSTFENYFFLYFVCDFQTEMKQKLSYWPPSTSIYNKRNSNCSTQNFKRRVQSPKSSGGCHSGYAIFSLQSVSKWKTETLLDLR